MNEKEKTWKCWTLSEDDIKDIAERYSLSLEGKDMDEIARRVKKGIEVISQYPVWVLDDVWDKILKDAIQNTKAEEYDYKNRNRKSN